MNSLVPRSRTISGFTLVEILVSISVLGLMMIGIAQMMNSALAITGGSYKHMDADTQARMVLDRMAYDISKITKRMDVDYYFQKNTGNDQMAFYSESGGYYPTAVSGNTLHSNTSLVGYMINNNNQLVRLSKGLVWNGASSTAPAMVFNPLANVATNPLSNIVNTNTITTTSWNGNANGIASGTDPDYQVIGDQVFRMEYSFLVQTAPSGVDYSNGATDPTTTSYYYDYPWTTTPDTTPNGLQNVTAIIVTIAVLDSKSRANVSSTTLQTAASYLEDDGFTSANGPMAVTPTVNSTSGNNAPVLPLYLWENDLAGTSSTGTGPANLGLPASAASQVRFYQRYCYLNHLQ
jgi:Tfp pilus assembly protein PilV